MTLNLCHAVTAFCDSLEYVLIKCYAWVSKCGYYCYSNLDLLAQQKYITVFSWQLCSEKLHLACCWKGQGFMTPCSSSWPPKADNALPSPWVNAPTAEQVRGVHLASLTSHIQLLQPWIWFQCGLENIADTWKTHCDAETTCSLIKYYLKSILKPVNEPTKCL